VICAGRKLRIDPFPDFVLGSPRDNGVDQPIAASVLEIGGCKALRHQDAAIVLLVGVKAQMLPRTGARLGRIAFEYRYDARADPFVRPHQFASAAGMLGQAKVSVRALGLARRQVERLWMKRRDHQRRRDPRWNRLVHRRFHPRYIFGQIAERFDVLVSPEILDQRAMAHANTEDEAARRQFSQRIRSHRHRHRVAHPHVRNPGGIDELFSVGENVTAVRERFSAPCLVRPDDLVTHPLEAAAKRGAFRRRHRVHEAERSNFADIHQLFSLTGMTARTTRGRYSPNNVYGCPISSICPSYLPSSAENTWIMPSLVEAANISGFSSCVTWIEFASTGNGITATRLS